MSCDITANHVGEPNLSASIKDWSHWQEVPLAFTITASISPGENNFPALRSLIAIFRIIIYALYFRLPAAGRLFRPTFVENDILITIGIVNNSLLFEFHLKPPQYLSGQEMPDLDLFICCTSYHLQQTSASPHRAPEFRSVHCIGIKIFK